MCQGQWCGKFSPANFKVWFGFYVQGSPPLWRKSGSSRWGCMVKTYWECILSENDAESSKRVERSSIAMTARVSAAHRGRSGTRQDSGSECFFLGGGRDLRVTFRDLSSALVVLSIVRLRNAVRECKSPSLHRDGIFKHAPKWIKCVIVAGKYVEIKRHAVSRQWKIGLYKTQWVPWPAKKLVAFQEESFFVELIKSRLNQCGHKLHRGD